MADTSQSLAARGGSATSIAIESTTEPVGELRPAGAPDGVMGSDDDARDGADPDAASGVEMAAGRRPDSEPASTSAWKQADKICGMRVRRSEGGADLRAPGTGSDTRGASSSRARASWARARRAPHR